MYENSQRNFTENSHCTSHSVQWHHSRYARVPRIIEMLYHLHASIFADLRFNSRGTRLQPARWKHLSKFWLRFCFRSKLIFPIWQYKQTRKVWVVRWPDLRVILWILSEISAKIRTWNYRKRNAKFLLKKDKIFYQ